MGQVHRVLSHSKASTHENDLLLKRLLPIYRAEQWTGMHQFLAIFMIHLCFYGHPSRVHLISHYRDFNS